MIAERVEFDISRSEVAIPENAASIATAMGQIMGDGRSLTADDRAQYAELGQALVSARVAGTVDVLALVSVATALVLRLSDMLPEMDGVEGTQPRITAHNAAALLVNALASLESATGVAAAQFIGRPATLN